MSFKRRRLYVHSSTVLLYLRKSTNTCKTLVHCPVLLQRSKIVIIITMFNKRTNSFLVIEGNILTLIKKQQITTSSL